MARFIPFSILSAVVSLFIVSCQGNKGGQGTETDSSAVELDTKHAEIVPSCTYTYIPDSTVVGWTAFKFNAKAPVGGRFTSTTVTATESSDHLGGIIEGLQFEIPTSSVNTNNPDRDKKIMDHFFGTLVGGDAISGKILSYDGNDTEGKVNLELTLNDSTRQVEGHFIRKDDGTAVLEAGIDVADWNGNAAIAALNKICEDLHRGEDGESKLWSTVDVRVQGYIQKDCEEK